MKRIIFVSNRLPVSAIKSKSGVSIKPSVGGLATGMKSIYKEMDSVWIGWPGINCKTLPREDREHVKTRLKEERCVPIKIGKTDMELYYNGFSNKTLWPIFHYFPQYAVYSHQFWKAYKKVNALFAEKLADILRDDDYVWIHDYHLLLLPKMIKDRFPGTTIGFFNHIPFPSYELFRLIPWCEEILQGMLGADLVGFHTYDYERHFKSCVRRIFGFDYELNRIPLGERFIKVDNFPMGIDYHKFNQAARKVASSRKSRKPVLQKYIQQFHGDRPGRKLILSIDRMDYSKGIPHRLYAFQRFLEKYPDYHGKVSLVMLTVPSRSKVSQYQQLKKEVDELVGNINGKYADLNWTPVWYFYRSMPFENLILLYHYADIGLITPVRDGMNLVAKEFIATKTEGKGVLILSELAGSAKEMNEAILINPNNIEEMADALLEAVRMPESEQRKRIKKIQDRLERYNVEKWAQEFIGGMKEIRKIQEKYRSRKLNGTVISDIQERFIYAQERILFLDYNGTLVGSKQSPEDAAPDRELYELLDRFMEDESVELVLMSSRGKHVLDQWFGRYDLLLFAEHGIWRKDRHQDWQLTGEQIIGDWKEIILPVIESYVDRTAGSYLEEMHNVLTWHYENTDPDQGILRARELKEELAERVQNMGLQIVEGKNRIEIKPTGMNKGLAALQTLEADNYDFIMAVGDDWTDENLFELLPDDAITLRVGMKKTSAEYNCETYQDVRRLLWKLSRASLGGNVKA